MTFSSKCIAPLLLALAIAFSASDIFSQASVSREELEQARQETWKFERPLIEKVTLVPGEPDIRQTAEYQRVVRKYFAELDSSVRKLAAIEMLDSRYVYIVERPLATELLGPLVRDADPRVKARAAKAIGYNQCGEQYAEELIGLLQGEPSVEMIENVAYAMRNTQHKPFVTHLKNFTDHTSGEARVAVVEALIALDPENAFSHNLPLLHDPTTRVRKIAVQSLSHIEDERSLALAEQMLHDPEPEVRERAVWTLGTMRSQDSAAVIARLLADPHHHVRGRAAEVLGKLKTSEHAEAVAALLADEDVVVRRYAVMGLGHMGQAKYLDALRPLLKDPDDQIRKYAAESIQQIEAASK